MITENKIDIPESNEWKSCCFKIDKQAMKYLIQVGILGGLIIFSSTMLVVDKSCESQRNYGALLMVCLGVFIPAPKMN
jgi:fluoride ion exporter CrcB/FEX